MSAKAGWSTPMLHVADIERSIRFYRLLGFDLVDVEGEVGCPLTWARMSTADGSAIMLLRGEEEHVVKPGLQGIMLVLYTAQLSTLREQLAAAGERPTEIARPIWMPSGHVMLRDPDACQVGINQWGDAEHEAWLKSLARKRAAGLIPQHTARADEARNSDPRRSRWLDPRTLDARRKPVRIRRRPGRCWPRTPPDRLKA